MLVTVECSTVRDTRPDPGRNVGLLCRRRTTKPTVRSVSFQHNSPINLLIKHTPYQPRNDDVVPTVCRGSGRFSAKFCMCPKTFNERPHRWPVTPPGCKWIGQILPPVRWFLGHTRVSPETASGDVKVSRPNGPRGRKFGLGLGLEHLGSFNITDCIVIGFAVLAQLTERLPILFNGPDNPQNCPFQFEDLDHHLIHGSLGSS